MTHHKSVGYFFYFKDFNAFTAQNKEIKIVFSVFQANQYCDQFFVSLPGRMFPKIVSSIVKMRTANI